MDDGESLSLTISSPQNSVRLNRTVYLWTIESIKHLQAVMNQVVDLCDQYGLTDDANSIKLWLPQRLTIDDIYTQKLKNNFDICNKLLDKLEQHLKDFV